MTSPTFEAVVFEEHASVLPHWAARGLHRATVVVLDAHLDLQHVDDARIERLRRCRDDEALRALESPHPFAVAPEACFGIEDFLYPAARLGLVGRIVWVAPPHVLRHGFVPALHRLVQMEGVSIDDIESLAITAGGWVEGRLLGIPLAVCTLEQLALLTLPAAWQLDIDVDYFVEIPGDRVWTDPLATLAQLRALPGCPPTLTISRSVGSGFTPRHLGALGDALAAAWADDATPKATPWYVLHSAAPVGTHRVGLTSLGPDLAPDLALDIAATHSRRLPLDAARLRHWQQALAASGAPVAPALVGPSWVMLGLLQCAAGRLGDACAADEQAATWGHSHAELALEIAGALAERGDGAAARAYAARAAADPATRARAWSVQMRIAALHGDAREALHCSEAQASATPCSPGALRRLAQARAAAGDTAGARAAVRRARHLAQHLDDAASRLSPIAQAVASRTGEI